MQQLPVNYYFILYAKDSFTYFKYLYEEGEIKPLPFPVYLDTNDSFLKQNKFLVKYATSQCFFTNNNNEVLLEGDFATDSSLLKKAISLIK